VLTPRESLNSCRKAAAGILSYFGVNPTKCSQVTEAEGSVGRNPVKLAVFRHWFSLSPKAMALAFRNPIGFQKSEAIQSHGFWQGIWTKFGFGLNKLRPL
jgi:hypothetical protein